MIDNPRLDLVIATYGRSITIVLVVIGVLAIAATGWAVANPGTETSPQMAEESVSTDVATSATVTQDGTLWNEGDRLENSSVYMLNASPELVVEPETRLRNETGGTAIADGAVTQELTLQFEASRDGEIFWTERHTELDASPSVEDGVARSTTTVDIESYRERKRHLEDEIGAVGTVTLEMHVDVEYDTGTHAGTQHASTTVRMNDEAYWLAEPLSATERHTHRIGTVQHSEPRNPALIGVLSLVGTLSLAGAAFVTRRAPIDVDAARRAVHEQRYAEWISRGSLPMWIGNHHVALDTLEDVVDVAIDTNERVVHDRQRGLFAVVNDEVVYYYSERGPWEQTTWPEMDLSEGAAGSSSGSGSGTGPGSGSEPGVTSDRVLPPDDLSEFDGSDEFADADESGGFDDDEEVWERL